VKGKVGERVDKAHNDSQEFFFLRFWCHNFFHSSISKHSKDFMLIWSFFLLVILFQSAGNDFKELLGRGACGKRVVKMRSENYRSILFIHKSIFIKTITVSNVIQGIC
jgi:hypothetical protein